MEYIKGTSREQIILFNESLDNCIEPNNPTRVIDLFIDNLDIFELGFEIPKMKTGKPPYNPKLLLKIYIYGYFEKIRTSRMLEKECKRNTEMIWLTRELVPNYKTIANFRKNNKKGIKNVFKDFLQFCKHANLLEFSFGAVDGSKIRAQNSLNNVYKRDNIENISKKIDEKIEKYIKELDENDKKDESLELKKDNNTQDILKKLEKLNKQKDKLEVVNKIFKDNPELQTYFSTDSDCRLQSDKGKVRPGYNVQTTVDNKHKLIVVSEVTNEEKDLKQMTPMVEKIKKIKKELGFTNKTDIDFDAGYFSEAEIIANKDDEEINIFEFQKIECKI